MTKERFAEIQFEMTQEGDIAFLSAMEVIGATDDTPLRTKFRVLLDRYIKALKGEGDVDKVFEEIGLFIKSQMGVVYLQGFRHGVIYGQDTQEQIYLENLQAQKDKELPRITVVSQENLDN